MLNGDVRFLMLSAMYENGGNFTHRLLDGHPQMFVYPFESQLGTSLAVDRLSSLFPAKYRWPVFALDATPGEDYDSIVDEETRVRARTPHVSKFRHVPFDFSDEERRRLYLDYVASSGRSRAKNVTAFFRATFDAWKDLQRSGQETTFVGYSPVIVVDADKILAELPGAHVAHIVRNPWSAYADTRKRPVPLLLSDYMHAWTVSQYHALLLREKFPGRLTILRFEDIVQDPPKVLGALCEGLGLAGADSLGVPSWNGTILEEVYPWGTIRRGTVEANRAAAKQLSPSEREEVRLRARPYLEAFDYEGFI